MYSGDLNLVKRYTLAQARKRLNKAPPKKALSINVGKIFFGVAVPVLAVVTHSTGGRNIVEIAADALGGNLSGLDSVADIAIDAVKKKPLAVIGAPVGVAVLSKVAGKWAPKAGVPKVVSVKAF